MPATKSYVFTIEFAADEFEDGRPAFQASCPSLPGCHTWGHTHEDALHNIQEAIELYIEDLIESGEFIPTDSKLGAIELPAPLVVVNV